MGYEQAKVAKLAASNCICCGRTLLDAVSVELGIGPVCRDKYLPADLGASEAQRTEANKLVAIAALDSTANAQKLELADQVSALGFPLFADIVRKRFTKKTIVITATEMKFHGEEVFPVLIVQTPFGPATSKFNYQLKNCVPWKDRKALWAFLDKPTKAKKSIWKGWAVKSTPKIKRDIYEALKSCFPGEKVLGPKGTFVLAESTS